MSVERQISIRPHWTRSGASKKKKRKKNPMQNRKISTPTRYANRTPGYSIPVTPPTSNFNFAAIPVKSEKPSGNQKISTRVGTRCSQKAFHLVIFRYCHPTSALPRSASLPSPCLVTPCSKWDWRIIIKRRQNSEFISARYLIDVAVDRGVRGPRRGRRTGPTGTTSTINFFGSNIMPVTR